MQAGPSSSTNDELDREGYVILRGVLDRGFLDRLRRAFEDTYGQKQGTQHIRVVPSLKELESWQKLTELPELRALVEHVLARPFAVDSHGRNPFSGYGEEGMHTNSLSRTDGSPVDKVSAVAMLDDFARDNGATRVVPGSHKIAGPIPKATAQPLARHPNEKVMFGSAGDILVMHGDLWHSDTRNDSDRPRRAIQMLFRALPPA